MEGPLRSKYSTPEKKKKTLSRIIKFLEKLLKFSRTIHELPNLVKSETSRHTTVGGEMYTFKLSTCLYDVSCPTKKYRKGTRRVTSFLYTYT